jgi:predicted Zn-dependent protease
VAAFEPVGGPAAARLAWEAGRQRWPDDHRAYLALGNLDYAAGDREAALAAFARGLAVSPREPVLSNNYASVLAETGCRGHGRRVLEEALEVLPPDSPWLAALTASRGQLPATSTDPARCAAR